MLLAKVLVQARRERSAENRIEHEQGKIIGRRSWNADPADSNLRLLRARLVYDVDLTARQLRGRRNLHPLDGSRGFPPAEVLVELGEHRIGADVAYDDQ